MTRCQALFWQFSFLNSVSALAETMALSPATYRVPTAGTERVGDALGDLDGDDLGDAEDVRDADDVGLGDAEASGLAPKACPLPPDVGLDVDFGDDDAFGVDDGVDVGVGVGVGIAVATERNPEPAGLAPGWQIALL